MKGFHEVECEPTTWPVTGEVMEIEILRIDSFYLKTQYKKGSSFSSSFPSKICWANFNFNLFIWLSVFKGDFLDITGLLWNILQMGERLVQYISGLGIYLAICRGIIGHLARFLALKKEREG